MARQASGRDDWAIAFEVLIWESPQEGAQLAHLDVLLRQMAGENLMRILGDLSNETLALAVQKHLVRAEASQELLWERRFELLTPLFHRLGLNSVEAQNNLLNSLFVHLLDGKIDEYDSSREFRVWCRRVAYHLWVWIDRKEKKRHGVSLDRVAEPFASRPRPDDEAACREFVDRVNSAIELLPDDQQQVLRERLNGNPPREIAKMLDKPIQVVWRLLHRARKAVRAQVGPLLVGTEP